MKVHTATKAQKKAFDSVVKAINRAKSLGLAFYGKQDSLVAYTNQADDYVNEIGFDRSLRGVAQIPYISAIVLTDSGADDYSCYKTQADKEKFNP
jgi:hypothetical protein